MTKILITGANGQLGSELKIISKEFPDLSVSFTDVEELDISNYNAVEKYFSANPFDFCINCAAYTAVDKAENETNLAFKLNVQAVRNLAEVTAQLNISLFHISTDFVFDGTKSTPYSEEDITNPLNTYAKSKLKGEQECMKNRKSMVIRTSWLYSSFGNNFVKTMQKLGREREQLGVVFDQAGTPTYANDLARVLLKIISQFNGNPRYGIYHYSNEGVCSWYDFAVAVMEMSRINCKVNPIQTHEYPTPAKRAPYTVLNKKRIKEVFKIEIPHWRESLQRCIAIIEK